MECQKFIEGLKEVDIMLRKWEDIKDKIVINLVNTKWNQARIEEVPHFDFMDLSVVYKILLYEGMNSRATCTVTEQMRERWGVSHEELRETALDNLKRQEHSISSMGALLFGTQSEEDEMNMYVMTNSENGCGATGMLLPEVLNKFAEQHQCSFYILPSSIFEVILLPEDRKDLTESLEEMVRDVNSSAVAPEERLSDKVYYFDWKQKKLSLAAA